MCVCVHYACVFQVENDIQLRGALLMTWENLQIKMVTKMYMNVCYVIMSTTRIYIQMYYVQIYIRAPRRFSHVNRKSITGDKSFTATYYYINRKHACTMYIVQCTHTFSPRARSLNKKKHTFWSIVLSITYLLIAADYCIYYCQTHRDRQNFLVEVKAMCSN